jgi:hypothetical protein
MPSIIKAMLDEIYVNATEKAIDNKITKLEKGEYWITLEQLEQILKEFEG